MKRFALRRQALVVAAMLVLLAASIPACNSGFTPPLPDTVDFNYDVRPILAQKCFLCHGPDAGSRKANLRLDTYEGATALSKEGTAAISPGHANKSMMLFRINHKDPAIVMPTPESNLQLTDRERAIIEKWIDQGANWKPYWAFIPPAMPSSLAKKKSDLSAIDFLIDKKLEEYGLDKSPEADRNHLIRRVSYLLTGLPPTPEELSLFINDASPAAYEQMVDRYLASPHFGERWARHWMDLVRYAETKGHEFDYTITGAWRYRDYLIRAFNSDLPYDQLVREHIAGDLLERPRMNPATGEPESPIATAFYAMTEGTHSPVDIIQDEADRIDNIIDVTGKTFQALTISCARCHDHKFDPITAKDYYALFGILKSTRFSPFPANLGRETPHILALKKAKDSIRIAIGNEWLKSSRDISLQPVKPVDTNPGDSIVMLGDFRNAFLQGWKSDGVAFTDRTTLGDPVFDAGNKLIALQTGIASSRIIGTGIFGALRSPDFLINRKFVRLKVRGLHASVRVIINNFQLISNPIYGGLDQHLDTTGWVHLTYDLAAWQGQKAYIEVLPGYNDNHVFKMPPDAFIEVEYAIATQNPQAVSSAATSIAPSSLMSSVNNWMQLNESATDINALNNALKKGQLPGSLPIVQSIVQSHNRYEYARKDTSVFFNGVYDGVGADNPVYVRGSHKDQSPDPVPRAFLAALNTSGKSYQVAGSGRKELAGSITASTNPLMARVMVNRIWHHLFGKGIVETVDNFGMQGKLPSNPELLDYLAIQFKNDRYSIKKTIRSIVLTETFRRSVIPDADAKKLDATNTYLSHFPVQRLQAESIRDGLLAAAGSLDTSMYGPPVPVHITSFMNGRGKPSSSGPVDGDRRRSVYLEVRRNFLDPMMTTFDRPMPFTAFGRRTVTNVPSQSLIMLNDPFVVMEATAMAKNLLARKKQSTDERIQWIYERCFSRPAKDVEIAEAKAFINKLAVINKVQPEKMSTDLALWKDYIHSVFNLKEFIYLM